MQRTALAGLLALVLLTAAARADTTSGPTRVTLLARPWGTVYYTDYVANHADIEPDMMGGYFFKRRAGNIRVAQEGDGVGIDYEGQHEELVVRPDGDELRILIHGKTWTLRRGMSGFELRIPGDVLTCRQKGQQVTLQGKNGAVTVDEDSSGFRVVSPAGTTTYQRAGDGPFTLQGPRLALHPYLRRGVHFEHDGVGVFIDFHLERLGRAFTLLDWDPPILVQ